MQRRPLRGPRRTTEYHGSTKIRPDVECPHEAVFHATASNYLRQPSHTFTHERTGVRIARRHPNVSAHRQLEWIPIRANQRHARTNPQITTRQPIGRFEAETRKRRIPTGLVQSKRIGQVDPNAVCNGKPYVDVDEQLIANDRAYLGSITLFEGQRVAGIIEHQRRAWLQMPRNVGRLNSEHSIAGRCRGKTIQSQTRRNWRFLGQGLRRGQTRQRKHAGRCHRASNRAVIERAFSPTHLNHDPLLKRHLDQAIHSPSPQARKRRASSMHKAHHRLGARDGARKFTVFFGECVARANMRRIPLT